MVTEAEKTISIYNYTEIEKVIKEYCDKNIAPQYKLKPWNYAIHMDGDTTNDVHIIAGPTVQVILAWPQTQPRMNTILRRVCEFIVRQRLLHSMELVPYAFVTNETERFKVWKKKEFGDISEIFKGLLPDKRIKAQVKYAITVTCTDKMTGISHTITDNSGIKKEWDLRQQCKYELSRIVTEFEAKRFAGEVALVKPVSRSMSLVPISLYVETKSVVDMLLNLSNDPDYVMVEMI